MTSVFPLFPNAELLAPLLDAAPTPVIGVGRDRSVVIWNAAAERVFGWRAAEVVGRPLPIVPRHQLALYEARLDLGFRGEVVEPVYEATRVARNGQPVQVQVTLVPITAPHGEIIAIVAVMQDLTAQQATREREQLRSMQNAAVAAFGQRAITERDVDALAHAALEQVVAALQIDYAELLAPAGEGTLAVTHHFGWSERTPAAGARVTRGAIQYDAFERTVPIARLLDAGDFEAAPHLHAHHFVFAAATGVRVGNNACVLAVFSSERELLLPDLYPLQAIAAMYAAASARRDAEMDLVEAEYRSSALLEQLPAIVRTVDHDLRITSLGGGARYQLERDASAYIGTRVSDDTDSAAAVHAIRAALAGEPAVFEGEDGGRVYAHRVHPLRDRDGAIAGAIDIGFDITDHRQAQEALRRSREELRHLSIRMNQLQEDERRRIAREVHDELGQRLTALRFELALLRREVQADERIASMLALVDETIVTVRRVATELRPAVLDDFGFRAAIEQELSAFQRRTGIETLLRITPDDFPLGRERATALYRIVQESMTNVARHSGATRVDVRIEIRNGWVYADVHDNGRGITEQEANNLSTLGLVGVRERAYAFGGDAVIRGVAGSGTHIAVRIPAGEP